MPTRATAKKATPKKLTPTQRRVELIKKYRQQAAIGAKYYAKADELFEQLRKKLTPGKRVKIDDDRYAVVVDEFKDQDKVFKPVAMRRYRLDIQDEAGKSVRLRDRKKKKKAA